MKRLKHQKNTRRFGAAILAATLITTCLLAGTLLKYVNTFNNLDSSRVAKFDTTTTFTGLFDQTYEIGWDEKDASKMENAVYSDISNNWYYPAGVDSDVVAKLQAPGTRSIGQLQITNNSEVSVNFENLVVKASVPRILDGQTSDIYRIAPIYFRLGYLPSNETEYKDYSKYTWTKWIGKDDGATTPDVTTDITKATYTIPVTGVNFKKILPKTNVNGKILIEYVWELPTPSKPVIGDTTVTGSWGARTDRTGVLTNTDNRDVYDTYFGNAAKETADGIPISVNVICDVAQSD